MKRRQNIPNSIWITATLAGLLFVSTPAALAGPLHDAARSGDAAAVERLLAGGVDANEKDAGLNTALRWAADKGRLEVIRVLVANGADINARDISDWTPIHHAVQGETCGRRKIPHRKGRGRQR